MLANATQKKVLAPGLLHHRSDFVRNSYAVMVPVGWTLDDLLLPESWLHAVKLKRFDRVECIAVDGSFDADLRVESVGQGFAQMRVLRSWSPELEPASEVVAAGARVGFSPMSKWRVYGLDGLEMARGYASKADAELALSGYLEEMGPAQ